jgi:hypothetical protein
VDPSSYPRVPHRPQCDQESSNLATHFYGQSSE